MVLFVGAAATAIVWGIRALNAFVRRWRAALAQVAARRGWDVELEDTTKRPARYEGFAPFHEGHDRKAWNCLSGTDQGVPFDLFTYVYEKGDEDRKTSHQFAVAVVAMPASSPGLTIEPETVGHKAYDALGGSDIDFESDAFSRRFWVTSDDARFAHAAITPEVMEWMLGLPRDGTTWQWRGGTLMLTRRGWLKPEECEAYLELAQGFRARVPRMLLAQAVHERDAQAATR